MEPSLDFVDNHATVFYREAEIEVEDITIPVEIWLTEDGQLNLETDRISPEGLTEGVYPEITGTTDRGETIVINDLFCITDSILSLNPQTVEICRNEDRIVVGEKITLYADVLGFQYKGTPRFSDSHDYLELLERTDWRAGGGNTADWSIGVRPLPEYTTRVNSIQNYHNLVRTVQLELSISGLYGELDRIANVADRLINQITWLNSFVQGTVPSYSILVIDDGIGEDSEPEYTRLRGVHGNAGGCCKKGHQLFRVGQELPVFLDRAYENYLEKQESFELNRVLGFYVDSLDPNRPVDVKFTNLCIATEMLANRLLPDQGCTEDQIKELIHTLEVEYRDLIPDKGSLKSKCGDDIYDLEDITFEYFWYRSRNHVIHGGSSVTTREIIRDHNSLRTLLQRILREIILEGETASLHGMKELEPNGFVSR